MNNSVRARINRRNLFLQLIALEGNVYVLEWCCELFFSELSLYQPTTSRIKGPTWVPNNSKLVFEVRLLQLHIWLWKMYKNIMLQKWILWHLTPYLVRFLFINNGCGNQVGLATLTNPKDPFCVVFNFYFLFYSCTLYKFTRFVITLW